ncbi:O-antigen ligase family protein, partial [Peribacillus simplex]|uniref:O-antigen ligase family protein n=1 Tax=Peribacillus simplex TaxID=1478 RepID=UPI0019232E02
IRKDVFKLIDKNLIIKKGLLILTLIIALYFSYSLLFDSGLFLRFQKLFENDDPTRINMYKTAFKLFEENPIVGIGFNNYRAVSPFQTYSHSTYAEVLATTGILGTILYFIPFLSLLVKTWFLSKAKDLIIAKNAKIMWLLLLTLLFLGTGVIHFYELSSTIALGFIIAFGNLYYRKDSKEIERR